MTHQSRIERDPDTLAGPVAQLVELRAVAGIVARLAGDPDPGAPVSAIDLGARFADAPGVARARFEAICRETTGYAAAGIEALLARDAPNPAAARRLALTLRRSLADMERSIGG